MIHVLNLISTIALVFTLLLNMERTKAYKAAYEECDAGRHDKLEKGSKEAR